MTDFDDRLARDFQSIFRLSESEARRAAVGRGGSSAESGFDRVTGMFTSVFGLSEEAAKRAASGRTMSVAEARRYWDSSGSSAGGRVLTTEWAREAKALLDKIPDRELDAMLAEEQARKRKTTPAKKAAATKASAKPSWSGKTRPAVISEWNRR